MRLLSGAAGVCGDACVSVRGMSVGMLLPSPTPGARALGRTLGGVGHAGPWWAESLERGQGEQKSSIAAPGVPPSGVPGRPVFFRRLRTFLVQGTDPLMTKVPTG